MERNYYKKNDLNEYNNYNNKNYNLSTQKKMDRKQKERIIKRIINKLSDNGFMTTPSNGCNKYTKEENHNLKIQKKKLYE